MIELVLSTRNFLEWSFCETGLLVREQHDVMCWRPYARMSLENVEFKHLAALFP